MTPELNPPAAPLPRLYSPNHSALACFLGSPIAGGYVLFRSLKRLGDKRATQALLAGLGCTAVLIAIGAVLPDAVGRSLPVVATIAWAQLARGWLQPGFDAHLKAGGTAESGWRAAGIGVLSLVMVLVVMVAGYLAVDAIRAAPSVAFGESTIFYDRGAKLADAQKVGEALKPVFAASTGGMEVRLTREGPLQASFVVIDRGWENEGTVAAFNAIRGVLETTVGEPVKVELTDDALVRKKLLSPP